MAGSCGSYMRKLITAKKLIAKGSPEGYPGSFQGSLQGVYYHRFTYWPFFRPEPPTNRTLQAAIDTAFPELHRCH
jgi:hypothetical protein